MPFLTPSLPLPPSSPLARPRRWGLAVTGFLALGLSASACSGQPCERLEHEICAQAGEAVCAQYKASAARVSENARQEACETLLSDKQALKMTLEALKRTHHGAAKPGTKPKPGVKAKAATSPATPAPPRQPAGKQPASKPAAKPAAESHTEAKPPAPAGPPAR